MIRFYSLFVLLDLALLLIALIGCLSAEEHEIRALPRIAWVFIILLFSPVGWIAWYVAGRPKAVPAGGTLVSARTPAGNTDPLGKEC